MTDKQIIIDGIDVSFCPNHYNGWSSLHRDTRAMCECGYSRECSPREFECSHYVKCLEKKLQAKEQECERLKEKYLNLKEQNGNNIVKLNTANEQLDQLKAENEELRKISCKFKDYCTCDTEKLKQTLTEIKEIAEDKGYIGFWDEQISLILDKISEVE